MPPNEAARVLCFTRVHARETLRLAGSVGGGPRNPLSLCEGGGRVPLRLRENLLGAIVDVVTVELDPIGETHQLIRRPDWCR